MKKLIVITFITMLTAGHHVSGTDRYLETMQKNIAIVYSDASPEILLDAVHALERIAVAEKTKWEPHYYAAFGYIMMATRVEDGSQKDRYLDQALLAVEQAKKLVPAESEVIALEGFCYMIRLTVDPATRGEQYAPRAMQTFGKATALNPKNPRAAMLTAQMMAGTARFFNTGIAEACAVNSESLKKFADYKSDNPLAPAWGKAMAESMSQQCR